MNLRIAHGIVIDDREIQERFVRAMGKDGQNANRAATAVELRLNVPASSLPAAVKARLIAVGGRHVTRDGVLVVVSRDYRSQSRNRQAARTMLADLVRIAARPPIAAERARMTVRWLKNASPAFTTSRRSRAIRSGRSTSTPRSWAFVSSS